MWGLYGWLLTKGQIVYVNAKYENPDFIAIYPEIYHGNQAGANTVVRYILNTPGVMGSPTADGGFLPGPVVFNPDDKIYVFSRIFDTFGVDDGHILFLPILNLHLFKDQKKKRTKKCVFVGKGQDRGLHPKDCIPIDRKFATDQKALASLLNECEVMYGYDPVSAMYEVARLCGCRIVLLQTKYSRDEWSKYEPGMNGISWGKDEGVPLETKGFRQHYNSLRSLFSRKLNRFIEETQK